MHVAFMGKLFALILWDCRSLRPWGVAAGS